MNNTFKLASCGLIISLFSVSPVYAGNLSAFLDKAQDVLEKNDVDISEYKEMSIDKLESLCCLNDSKICSQLGEIYLKGNKNQKIDVTKASMYLDKACKLKNGEVCAQLSEYYLKGSNGFKKNKEKAQEYLSIACRSGYKKACELNNL